MIIPEFIVHYSRGTPFQSITSVAPDLLPNVIASLHEGNAWGLSRFSNSDYLKSRVKVEKQMREAFITKGGKPQLETPFYFFLGRNTKFEQHPQNTAYKILLKNISAETISFTYGDSMLSFDENNRKLSDPKYQNNLCQQVFRINEIPDLFSELARIDGEGLHIEAQLWSIPNQQVVSLIQRTSHENNRENN